MLREDGKVVALPSIMAIHVERLVCHHRRSRKVLWEKKPANWEEKLKTVNQKIQTIVLNRKTSTIARSSYVKRNTQTVNGQLEFASPTKTYELVRLGFEVENSDDPAGPGTYFLWSINYPRRPLRCVSAVAQRNGFDILREAYEG